MKPDSVNLSDSVSLVRKSRQTLLAEFCGLCGWKRTRSVPGAAGTGGGKLLGGRSSCSAGEAAAPAGLQGEGGGTEPWLRQTLIRAA